ncbi:adenine nucleotide alpha hydrolase [Chitinivorax sp. B]|uniref:adenine nucleotide alpha hydrolase n=1 Tax=Chitinivorax sp. B TaxID=2502235 RepID=UPI0010F68A43|nr:adenine nucleotide alpha hydrolase [Chitinivorax sp. B]
MRKKTLLSWSSGKDSAWALHVLRQQSEYEVVGLFTTVNAVFNRVAMHATQMSLLQQQAAAAGLPVHVIRIPHPCSDADYANAMWEFVDKVKMQGIECMAFGDLFLEDVRRYREESLCHIGIEPVFPLWGIPTDVLADQMLAAGVKAYVCCVDPRQAPSGLAGCEWNRQAIEQLPPEADPCGERGEFHTIVVDGPFFNYPISVQVGIVVERDEFVFADIVPVYE